VRRSRFPFSAPTLTTLVSLPLLALAGCEAEVEPEEVYEEGVIVIDASSPFNFAYLSLADGGKPVSPTDPTT